MAKGAKLLARTTTGETVFHWAARANQAEFLNFLQINYVAKGKAANRKLKMEDNDGNLPAHAACAVDATDALAHLLTHGTPTGATNKAGRSLLHVAARSGSEKCTCSGERVMLGIDG